MEICPGLHRPSFRALLDRHERGAGGEGNDFSGWLSVENVHMWKWRCLSRDVLLSDYCGYRYYLTIFNTIIRHLNSRHECRQWTWSWWSWRRRPRRRPRSWCRWLVTGETWPVETSPVECRWSWWWSGWSGPWRRTWRPTSCKRPVSNEWSWF